MSKVLIDNLIEQFHEIYNGSPWLEETIFKKLDGLDETTAFEKPLPNLHSVAEIISHLVVWRNEITNRLLGQERKIKMASPENWLSNENLKITGWAKLRENFNQSQDRILGLLNEKEDSFLEEPFVDRNFKYLVEGLIHHDIYHLGQIGIVIKLLHEN